MEAQNPTPPPAEPRPAADLNPQTAPPPKGQVIIQSHGQPPSKNDAGNPIAGEPQEPAVGDNVKADITDADRSALLITAYDLDARLAPANSGLNVRARISVKNEGSTPLKELALQISSTLHWDGATLVAGPERTRLPVAQHRLDTDADHTGAETEAILPLPKPLAPGASADLDLFYSGTVPQNGARLARLGADSAQEASTDWDAIGPDWTALRGFGDVIWYPVAQPQVFLGDANALFEAVGHARFREQSAPMRLRLTVEYSGDAPVAAYFCGRRAALKPLIDNPYATVASGSGIATAEFSSEPLGFRTPSLFLLNDPETLFSAEAATNGANAATESSFSSSSSSSAPPAAPNPPPASPVGAGAAATVTPSSAALLAIESNDAGAERGFAAAATRVAPLLREWLGPEPLSALTAIDHRGQPFQDGPLLVGPLAVLQTSPESQALVQSLTHAWVQTGQPWMDEGLAQFFALLWTEREDGRDAANAQLGELMRPVGLAEPDPASGDKAAGQPLIAASDDVFYRRKAAAVWWMLRGIVGDGNLHAALAAWRVQPASHEPAAAQAVAFEHLLERLSGQQLGWFFDDWVLHDRGLPDLTISDVGVAQEPAGAGHAAGWLVAVTVQNEGGAVAEVPVIVRSGANQILRRMRIPGMTTITQRVLVENAPTSVIVNDGSTPELRASTHTRDVNLETR